MLEASPISEFSQRTSPKTTMCKLRQRLVTSLHAKMVGEIPIYITWRIFLVLQQSALACDVVPWDHSADRFRRMLFLPLNDYWNGSGSSMQWFVLPLKWVQALPSVQVQALSRSRHFGPQHTSNGIYQERFYGSMRPGNAKASSRSNLWVFLSRLVIGDSVRCEWANFAPIRCAAPAQTEPPPAYHYQKILHQR